MSILIFTNTLLPGGTEKQVLLLTKALKNKYNTILLVYYGEQCQEKYLNYLNKLFIKPIRLNGSHIKKAINIYKIIKHNKINIIFSFLATSNLLSALIGKFAGVKFLIGGIRTSLIQNYKLVLQKLLHNYFFNYTIFNNYSGKDRFIECGFNKNKIVVIPNSIELINKTLQKEKKELIRILSVGRFVKQKDYPKAIEIIDNLIKLKCVKNIQYVIVGYGEEEKQIRNLIEKKELNSLVKIIINPDNLEDIYSSSDIFLSTSKFEGLSNTIMEAMSHSLPIIATNVSDNFKLVYNNENGFLVNINDDKVAEKLNVLVEDYELRIKFGNKSFEIITENYSFDIFQKRYIDFIESFS